MRRYLAWSSILAEKEALNLDPHQVRQAETQKQAADGAVTARLPETYQWLLVPEQATPQAPVDLAGDRGSRAAMPSRCARARSCGATSSWSRALGSTILRKHLDDVLLWRGDHVAVRQLVEDFARYLYLPRLAGPEVLGQRHPRRPRAAHVAGRHVRVRRRLRRSRRPVPRAAWRTERRHHRRQPGLWS